MDIEVEDLIEMASILDEANMPDEKRVAVAYDEKEDEIVIIKQE